MTLPSSVAQCDSKSTEKRLEIDSLGLEVGGGWGMSWGGATVEKKMSLP